MLCLDIAIIYFQNSIGFIILKTSSLNPEINLETVNIYNLGNLIFFYGVIAAFVQYKLPKLFLYNSISKRRVSEGLFCGDEEDS